MTEASFARQEKIASGANTVLGAWLVVSPWALTYPHVSVAWNALLMGALILYIGITRVTSRTDSSVAHLNVLFGLWTVVSPWILGYADGGAWMWNGITVGSLVAFMAAWSAWATSGRNRQDRRRGST